MGLCQCECGQETKIATKTRRGLIKGEPTKWINGHKRRYLMLIKRKEADIKEINEIRPFCLCGCGKRVNKVEKLSTKNGLKKGEFYQYIEGHVNKGKTEKRLNTSEAATGCSIDKKSGTLLIYDKEHPKCHPGRMIPEAHLIAEAALGKHLPPGACVLHADKESSGTKNLIVCQDKKYMQLLRQRIVAYEKSGHANYRACAKCKEYDDPINMVRHTVRSWRHVRGGCSR